jgi:hypothetical protein
VGILIWQCENLPKKPDKVMEGIVIGLPINLEKVFGNEKRNIVDKEKLDDYEIGVCVDRRF